MPPLAFEEARRRVGTLTIAGLLAAAGGFLDGFTYVGHGHVFANAMTGNVVLLGINCFSGSWQAGLRHVPAIVAFLVGVCVAQVVQVQARRRNAAVPYSRVLALEVAVLLALSWLPAGTADIVFTTLICFAASVQVQSFREVNGQIFNSTFTTGNLRTLVVAATDWFLEGRKPETARTVRDFSMICGLFFLGAIAGGFSTQHYGNKALWVDVMVLGGIAIHIRAEGL
jgi:uncharacterized membrane protein YoaK (UPF0700 family)